MLFCRRPSTGVVGIDTAWRVTRGARPEEDQLANVTVSVEDGDDIAIQYREPEPPKPLPVAIIGSIVGLMVKLRN